MTASPASDKSTSKQAPSLFKAAGLMAGLLLISKGLGFIRDWMILTVYGASGATDAYFAAVQLPQASLILLGGLGGPFYTATVSVFARLLPTEDDSDKQKARKLASTFLTLTGLAFTGLSVLAFFFAQPIMTALLPGSPDSLINASAEQLRIMSPVILIGGLVGIFYGLLNVLHVYIWPALSPAAMSLVMISLLWLAPSGVGGELLAWSTLGGAGLQLLLQLPSFLRSGLSLRPALMDWGSTELKAIGELLFPAMLGTTIGQLTTFVDMAFAACLQEGGWSAVTLSNRLMQLPIGVLQTALLVPLFPRLSALAAEGKTDELARNFRLGVGALWVVSVPILVVLLFFAEPLIKVIFEHGQFDEADTQLLTLAVLFQAFSILPYFARDTLTRVFYAFQDAKTPLLVGFIAIGTKALLNWLLVLQLDGFGVGGITLSISLVTLINALLLGFMVRKHGTSLQWTKLFASLFKLLLAGLIMATVIIGLRPSLEAWMAQQAWLQAIPETFQLLLPVSLLATLGLLVYSLACWMLRVEETDFVFEKVKARFGRSR